MRRTRTKSGFISGRCRPTAAALVTYTSSKWSNEGALGHRRLKALLYPDLMEKEMEEGF